MLSKITVKNKPRPLIGLFCIDIVKSCDRIGQEPNSLLRVNLEDDFLLSKIENSLHFSEQKRNSEYLFMNIAAWTLRRSNTI